MKLGKLARGLMFAALVPTVTHAQEVILKVAHFAPPTSPGHVKFVVPWCDKVAAESAGRIQCQHYPAMMLGGTAPQLLSQVRDGVADVVWTLPGYTPGRLPLTEVFELPFICTDQESSSRAVWDFVEKHTMGEFAGLKPIAVWVPGSFAMHLRDKELKSLVDLKDLKIRGSSRLTTRLLASLGAQPVGMPMTQMAESLSKGIIEATMLPWEVVPSTKVHELTKYSVEFGGEHTMSTTVQMFVMNRKKYDSLPPELKKVIDDNSGRETSAWISAQLKTADAAGLQTVIDRGNTVHRLPAEEMAKWEQATRPVIEEWIDEVSAKGADGRKLYEDAVALVQYHSGRK